MLLQLLLPFSGRQKDDDQKTSVTVADPESFSSVKINYATVLQSNMVSLDCFQDDSYGDVYSPWRRRQQKTSCDATSWGSMQTMA